jgi:transcriptional regulator with XRE-family HTH domain
MNSKRKTKSDTMKFLEKLMGGPLTLARLLQAIRLGEEETLTDFSKKLGISKQHLCDIEKGRKVVSPERAARFARVLGRSEIQFVKLALQAMLDEADLHLTVEVRAA